MEVVSPVILDGASGLQIVRYVLADRDSEHQGDTHPEGPVQIWIWPYVRYEIIVATVRYHGPLQPLQHVVRIDVEELLIILDRPEVVLGGTFGFIGHSL